MSADRRPSRRAWLAVAANLALVACSSPERIADGTVVDVGLDVGWVTPGESSFFVGGATRNGLAGAVVRPGDDEGPVVPAELATDGELQVPQPKEAGAGRWVVLMWGCTQRERSGGRDCTINGYRLVEVAAGRDGARRVADLSDIETSSGLLVGVAGDEAIVYLNVTEPMLATVDTTTGRRSDVGWAPYLGDPATVRTWEETYQEMRYGPARPAFCMSDHELWVVTTAATLAGVPQSPTRAAVIDVRTGAVVASADIETGPGTSYDSGYAECSASQVTMRGYVEGRHVELVVERSGEVLTAVEGPGTPPPVRPDPPSAVTTDGRWRATADGTRLRIERVR